MQYWLGRNGQKLGPYTIEDLRGMATNGGAVASDLVWTDGMANWAPLFTVIPPPQPPAAPPPPSPPQPVPMQNFAPPPPPAPMPMPQAPQPQYQPQQAWNPQPLPMPQYQMAMPMPMPNAVPSGLMPPNLHWAAILGIGMLPFGGFFQLYWLFKEASFVKKLDPNNKAIPLLIASFSALLLGIPVILILAPKQDSSMSGAAAGIMVLVMLAVFVISAVCSITAMFQLRASLINYYNTVEPIGLRLSGVMTFFFAVFYFQHHFSRIAKWKTTGVLDPQG